MRLVIEFHQCIAMDESDRSAYISLRRLFNCGPVAYYRTAFGQKAVEQ